MVGLEHGVRRVQLLNVRIVRIDVVGERLLARLLSVAHITVLVVQATLSVRNKTKGERKKNKINSN